MQNVATTPATAPAIMHTRNRDLSGSRGRDGGCGSGLGMAASTRLLSQNHRELRQSQAISHGIANAFTAVFAKRLHGSPAKPIATFVVDYKSESVPRGTLVGAKCLAGRSVEPRVGPGGDSPLSPCLMSTLNLSSLIEHFAHLARQGVGSERLLQERNVGPQDAMVNDRVVGVAGHEQHLEVGLVE